jgi:hypothetical protein
MTRWEIDGQRARVVSAPRAPWQTDDAPDPRWYAMPGPPMRRPARLVEPTAEQRRNAPVLCATNDLRAARGLDPYPIEISAYEIERRKGKAYEEHASYPIEIVLPLCGCCGEQMVRCGCPLHHKLPVGVAPAQDRPRCLCPARGT